MTGELSLVALAVAGSAGCASWLAQMRRAVPMLAPRHSATVAAATGLTALAALTGLVTGDPAHPVALGLLCLAALAAGYGVAVATRLATVGPGPGHAAAEAVLVGGSLVSILWAVAGVPAQPDAPALVALALTTADITVATLAGRLPLVPGSRPPDHRYRRSLFTGVAAVCCLAAADVGFTLEQVGSPFPSAAVSPALRALAAALTAVAPWIPPGPPGPVHRPRTVARALPYALVATAVAAQLVAAFRRPVGPVPVVLVALVVGALAVVQALGRREIGRLVRDLDASRTRLAALVENAGDVILAIDAAGRVASASGAASRLLHRAPEAMNGLDVAELAAVGDRAKLRDVVDPVVRGLRGAGRVELRLAAPATGTAELRLRSVAGGAVANLSDVTESVQLRERLERLARFDEMTGLPNRSHLVDAIDGWLRADQAVAVLYTDLDGFKGVNDRFGHQRGDDVLVETARRLQFAVIGLPVERVLVARMGGDEFVVALLGAGCDHVAVATERLLAAMHPTFDVADRAVRVGLSIGVATTADEVPDDLDEEDAGAARLLHRADVAMFAAKQAGRFRVVHWDAATEARALRRVDIAIGLRRALEGRRLGLAFQPLVRLADGVVIGAEALVRVSPSDRGPGGLAGLLHLVTPAELVAVAEDTGEIGELGQWVITEATAQAARWRAAGHDVFVTVNVSVGQMAGEGFVDSVIRALKVTGLPPDGLVVEITEGQFLSETDPAWQAVEQLKAFGVALVIDDFGSGYSSLAYLRRMPVRGVKLDRALLDDLTTDPRARTLARAVISAARALGLLVVAEGLETFEAARVVRDLGAWAGQGFALFEALSADDVAEVLGGPPVDLGGPGPTPAGPRALSGPMPATIDLADGELRRRAGVDLT